MSNLVVIYSRVMGIREELVTTMVISKNIRIQGDMIKYKA